MHPIKNLTHYSEVTPELMKCLQKRVIFFDVDNTLFIPKKNILEQDVSEVIQHLKWLREENIIVIGISNNFSEDRKSFFRSLDIPAVFFAKKPTKKGFKEAFGLARLMNPSICKADILHVGDQLLTDGIGATRFGIDYGLVHPISGEHDLIFALPSRILERMMKMHSLGK